MVYSAQLSFASSVAGAASAAATVCGGSGGGSAPPMSRPSTPVVGPSHNGGTLSGVSALSLSSSYSMFGASARAKLAALTVALPSLAEGDEPDSASSASVPVSRRNGADGDGMVMASAAVVDDAGVISGLGNRSLSSRVPAPSPAAGAVGVGAFAVSHNGSGAPHSRPSTPVFDAIAPSAVSSMPSLQPLRLNREDAVSAPAVGGGFEGGFGGAANVMEEKKEAAPALSVSVPAVVTVTAAGAVTESSAAASVPVGGGSGDALDALAARDADAARREDTMHAPVPLEDVEQSFASFGASRPQAVMAPLSHPPRGPFGAGPVPFGAAVAGGFVSNDAPRGQQSQQHHPQAQGYPSPASVWNHTAVAFGGPQRPLQSGPTPQQQQLMMQQRFLAQQRAAQAQQHQQHQQQAMARMMFAQRQQHHQQQQQQVMHPAMAMPPAADEALVPACNGRCRQAALQPRVAGLGMLALTRTGSIACPYCGQRAYSKVATVDTDPYALSSSVGAGASPSRAVAAAAINRTGSGDSGSGGRTPTIPSLSSPPHVSATSALAAATAHHHARPVSSYGALRRARPKAHAPLLRRASMVGLSPDSLASALAAEESSASPNSASPSSAPGVAVASAAESAAPRYNPYLSDEQNACAGVGDGVTHASLKSRRSARRAGQLAASILPRARVVLVAPANGAAATNRSRADAANKASVNRRSAALALLGGGTGAASAYWTTPPPPPPEHTNLR